MTPDNRLWVRPDQKTVLLAIFLLLPVGTLAFSACGQPEDRTPATGYTESEERMPTQFQGGAPGQLPAESEESDFAESRDIPQRDYGN